MRVDSENQNLTIFCKFRSMEKVVKFCLNSLDAEHEIDILNGL